MAKAKFWMVLGSGVPTFRHPTKGKAIAEAERLAKLYPNCEFTLLESVASCKKSDVTWQEMICDGHDNAIPPF